ncbi:MAG: ATP synthase subunit I, partial [Pyrinomonadaceae bacterium]
MGDKSEPVAPEIEVAGQTSGTISHRRLLIEMMAVTAVTGVIGLIAGSERFFAGVIVGGIISILNFLWLERSLGAIFRAAVEGEKPRFLAARYFLRYVLIGLVLLGVY